MRCAYLGLPRGAAAIGRAGHELMAVGLSRRSSHSALGVAQTCPVLFRPDTRDPSIQRIFQSAGAELLLCFLWDRILPTPLLDAFRAVLNYHPSLLPRHRGPDPTFWTIWSGDLTTGVSIIQLDAGVDTGPIIAQHRVPVPSGVTAGKLADLLDPLGLELMLDVIARWEREGPIAGVAQNDGDATDAPIPDDDLLELRWSWPAERLARLIRAAAPHPGAFTSIDINRETKTLIVLAAHPIHHDVLSTCKPGDGLLVDEGVMVCTAEGGLILDAVHLEGEEPRCTPEAVAALYSLAEPV